jgi:hypothetical protein
MKTYKKYFLPVFLFIVLSSCSDEAIDPFENPFRNKQIKAEVIGGETTTKFLYNLDGNISEKQSYFFYSRYIYEDGHLLKIETAADPNMLSSVTPRQNVELMTSENSTISGYQIFKYDQKGKLSRIENFFDKANDGNFTYTSMRSFEYDGNFISKRNLHNELGEITQFHTYEYDARGNVSNEKYYSNLHTTDSQSKLISEHFYKYDTKKNPFTIFRYTGNPGLNSNPNNVIETRTIRHEQVPGFSDHSTSRTSYEYNLDDYPVKVIRADDFYEYRY